MIPAILVDASATAMMVCDGGVAILLSVDPSSLWGRLQPAFFQPAFFQPAFLRSQAEA
ncbi:MAG TPA: hypothetical protein PKE27_21255 [Povalibacter sp.]|nr:hypothetical protein [Povalibacter sp.]